MHQKYKHPFFSLVVITLTLLLINCSSSDNSPEIDDKGSNPDQEEVVDEPQEEEENNNEEGDGTPNAYEYITQTEDYHMLSEALNKVDASLTELLSGEKMITLFAPTDMAFSHFLESLDGYDSLDDFDEASEIELLQAIIRHHLLNGKALFSEDFINDDYFTSEHGEEIKVKVDESIYLETASQQSIDLIDLGSEVANGVVHGVNEILWPTSVRDVFFPKPTLKEIIVDNENLQMFEDAMMKADLFNLVEGEEAVTIFAPNNQAVELLFEILGDPYDDFDDFQNFFELQVLNDILLGHFTNQRLLSTDFKEGVVETLLTNDSIQLVKEGEDFMIKDASEIRAYFTIKDVEAKNGVVHIIDKILLPQKVLQFLEK
ncbi:MAG: hypothetical protein CML05_13920 [Pseudozobellia sp.]|nr:hypothetical protein [Pseudozobellia sp.]MBG49378.1 hypothetical protein [Pseudozobellia sp.]|tara:strand:- start:8024 stop:9145 length:1122 start_codon:yes stop_codon:yes gene_type:complete